MYDTKQEDNRTRGPVLTTGLLALALLLAASSASADLTDDLKSYWSFDGNADDGVGTVHLAAVEDGSTVSYVSGLVGQSLSVPRNDGGGGSYVESLAPAGIYDVWTDITVSIWYKQTDVVLPTNTYHFAQPDYTGLSMYTTDVEGKGYGTVDRVDAGGVFTFIPAGFEAADVWQHRVLRISDGAAHLIDQWYARETDEDHGSADSQVTLYRRPEINGTIPLRIGWNRNNNADFVYDEIAVWNRRLTDEEIEQLLDLGKAGTPLTGTLQVIGDANLDGVVNDADLSLLLAHWDQDVTGEPDGGWGKGEFDAAAPVQDNDLSLLLANWTSGAAVPGPVPLMLVVAAAPLVWRPRRR